MSGGAPLAKSTNGLPMTASNQRTDAQHYVVAPDELADLLRETAERFRSLFPPRGGQR